jgi:hypothetical protein
VAFLLLSIPFVLKANIDTKVTFKLGEQRYIIKSLDSNGKIAICNLKDEYGGVDENKVKLFSFYIGNEDTLNTILINKIKNEGVIKNFIILKYSDRTKKFTEDNVLLFDSCLIGNFSCSEKQTSVNQKILFQNSTIEFLNFSDSKFLEEVSFHNIIFYELKLKNNVFTAPLSFKNIYINSCELNENFFRAKISFDSILYTEELSLSRCSFYDTLVLSNIVFNPPYTKSKKERYDLDSATFLRHTYFGEKSALVLNNLSLQDLKMDLEDIIRVDFPLNVADRYEDKIKFFNNGIKYINSQTNISTDVKQETISKLNFEKFRVETQNDLQNNFPAYVWDKVILFTVNAGHKGIKRFFTISFSIIGIFSLFYFFSGHRREIYALMNISEVRNYSNFQTSSYLYEEKSFWNLIRSIWFSSKIYFSPVFHSAYFYPTSSLLKFVILVEYCFGFIMLILFLIYLAPNFVFLRAFLPI